MLKKRLCFILPLIFILLTVLFIWSNSMKDADASTAQSDLVGDIIKRLVNVERPPFDLVYRYRRKLAHITEFALLGCEVCVFVCLNFGRRPLRILLGALACSLVAMIDEAIQLTSPGRAAAWSDVLIDSTGVLLGTLLALLVLLLVFRPSGIRKTKKTQ